MYTPTSTSLTCLSSSLPAALGVPLQMATYSPVLLGSVNTIPDDSAVSDLPHGQVDYLSHEWREEDVWRSWRNMTRLKNEIANGVRLENASWRTWWKQRNGLKTITPETLNWLKDSDVTWLYGPLHTADPTPKPSASAAAALDLSSSPSPALSGIVRKPILKHRSICELLTEDFPLSPVFSPLDSEEEDAPQIIMSDGADPDCPHKPLRPSLLHTKSDSHITRWGALRRDSPPRVAPNIPADPPASSLLQSESPPAVIPGQKRKHISFNTFVEQCIAIDKPKKKHPHFSTSNPHLASFEDDGYDEDSEDGIIDEADEILFDDDRDTHHHESSYPQISHPHPPHHSPPPHNVSPPSSSTSEEEEEDDVLEMRVRHAASNIPRSPTHSSSSSTSSSRSRPPNARSASYMSAGRRRHATNGFIMRSPSTDKELVTIALIAPTTLKTKLDDDDDSPYPISHTHLPSYLRRPRDNHNDNDSHVELVYVPPSYLYSAADECEDMIEQDRHMVSYEATQPQLLDQPLTASPPLMLVVEQEHVDTPNPPAPAVDPKTTPVPRRAEGASIDQSPAGPQVIVSSSDGQPDTPQSRSRSRSRSMSRSRTPSPNEMIASTNAAFSSSSTRATAPAQPTGTTYLAPSDPAPSRGRTSSSSQVPQPRGRSITRTSSFSDRESISAGSPEANVGLGIGSVVVRDRERVVRSEKEGRRSTERGRDRCARRSGSHSGSGSNSSLSPESPHAVGRVVVQPQPEQLSVPEVRKKSASVSSSGSSTATVVSTSAPRSPPRLVLDAKPITQTSYTEAPPTSIPISPSCAQEEQESISRHPTPANSPVLAMHSTPFPIARHERKPSSGSSRSPTRNGDDGQQGTLVGRAVEIMSTAGTFLGSFWHSGAPPGVPAS
ncbi:hypothetical protein OG21DRAFT_1463910 [Imleria badia]|nr:hypothetical protein OG21DRAFT_1463910 [Imleria badia]